MSDINICMVSKDTGTLQIPYGDYISIMEKVEEGRNLQQIKAKVIENLQRFTGGNEDMESVVAKVERAKTNSAPPPKPKPVEEKVSVKDPVEEKKPVEVVQKAKAAEPAAPANAKGVDIPPIKKNVSAHFNKLDESGRLFSVFKQYYTCLNDTCGGTVTVTMKDGVCSFWNYDEWEEFAFIDIFEGQLRMAVDPRYTDALQSLNLCEVPRLLSSRRSLICVQLDDLNNIMLDVLAKAFKESGLKAS